MTFPIRRTGIRAMVLFASIIISAASHLSAQITTIDGFSWTQSSFKLQPDLSLTARASYTTWSDAVGGETDILMIMPVVGDTAAQMALLATGSSLWFESSGDARSQWFISYDGIDLSADTLRATSGLRGFDLTAGGFQNQFVFDAFNRGAPLSTSIVVLSDTSNISQAEVVISPGVDTSGYSIPFDGFTPVGSGADFTSVNAIVVIVGSGGGADGPVDLGIMNFGTDVAFPPISVGDTVLYDQRNGTPGAQWFTNQFAGNDPFSAEAADDFTVSAAANWKVKGFTIEGTYLAGPGANPTARLAIISDSDNGPYGDTLVSYPNLPVGSWNPFQLPLPDTGLGLSAGTYWVTVTLNSPPGTEGFFRGSPTPFGSTALWRNPLNGFGFGCTTFTPLNDCIGNDQSFLFSVTGSAESPGADIGVDIVASRDSLVMVGDSINYTVTVSNLGQLENPNTEVGVSFEKSMILSFEPSQGSCDNKFNNVGLSTWACQLGLLAPGDTATIAVESIVSRPKTVGGGVVFKPDEFPDEVAANNRATFNGFATSALSVDKVADGTEFLVGSEITFEVTVRNESAETVDGVRVDDQFSNRAYKHLSDTGDCGEFDYEDPYLNEGVVLHGLRCELGTMAPGEERSFEIVLEAVEASGKWSNQADAFSSRGLEDRSGVAVELKGELATPALLFLIGVLDSRLDKAANDPIDVYLNETRLADDLAPGQATSFVTVPIATYPSYLYLTGGDAPDRSSAFDTLEVPLAGTGPGTGTALILTTNADDQNQVVVIDRAKLKAANPDGINFAFVHAAPAVPTVNASLEGVEITPSPIAFGLPFGESTDFYDWETPASFNLRVTPVGDEASEEVFSVDLSSLGLAYLLVLGPDSSAGKLDATSLYVVDSQGQTSISQVVTSAESQGEVPAAYALHENYPNPFNPTTRITYDVPEAVNVNISVYDVSGRRVNTLVDGLQRAGSHSVTWQGRSDSGVTLASGVYFYRMTSGSFVASRKMILLK